MIKKDKSPACFVLNGFRTAPNPPKCQVLNFLGIAKLLRLSCDEEEFFTFKSSFVIVKKGSKVRCILNC